MKTCLLAGVGLLLLAAPSRAEETLPCAISQVIKNDETLLVSFTAVQKLDIGEGASFWVSPKALLVGNGKSETDPAPAIPLHVGNIVTQHLSDGTICTLSASHGQQGYGLAVKQQRTSGPATESFIQQQPSGAIRSIDIRPFFTTVVSYPRPAYDLPNLRTRFDREIAEGRAGALKQDAELLAIAAERPDDLPSPNSSETEWTVAGETKSLLSLKGEGYAYMGGAHGEGGNMALLWDKTKDQPIAPATNLFKDGLETLHKPYCAALEQEKKRVRGQEGPDPVGENCPAYKDLAIVLTGAAGEKFSAVQIIANPYVTGSYAEGTYAITLPLTAAALGEVKPEWRDQFVGQ